MNPDTIAQQRAAEGAPELHAASLPLAPATRRAMFALAAVHTEILACPQHDHDPAVAAAKLDWWRIEIDRFYARSPQHPVTQALALATAGHDLPREHFDDLIAGAEMDLRQHRYLDFRNLERYCTRTGSSLALLAAEILGATAPASRQAARDIGAGLRIAEIIRDVGRHARQNRIYLPTDDLRSFGVPAADVLGARHSEDFRRLIDFEIDRTTALFDAARAAIPTADRRAMRPLLAAAAISRTLLDEIRRAECRVLTQRIALTPVRILWIAWKTRLLG